MTDLDPLLKRLHLANARRVWRDLVQRAEKEQWTYEALLLTLFSEEVAHRRGTRLARAVRAAAFPFLRTIDEFDFTYQSTLRLTTVGSRLTPDFVTEGRSVIFEGKPGRGKTHLAIALAYRAMQNGFDALFLTAAELIDHLSAASRDGKLREALAMYMKPHVLVVDEVGYLTYGDDAANVLYHVVNDRHIRRRSMIFTTNKDPKRWGGVLHDDDLAEAIVDRILERGRLLRLDGPSLRTKHLAADELADSSYTQPEPARVSGTTSAEFPERTNPESEPGIRTRNPNPESEPGVRTRSPNPESEPGVRTRSPNPESDPGVRSRGPIRIRMRNPIPSPGAPVGRVVLACLPLRERSAPAPPRRRRTALGAGTLLSLWGGMQARTTRPTSQLLVLELSIQAIALLRPIVARIREHDRDLSEQLRRALSSVSLNIAEGDGSRGGNRVARFATALGSSREARAALRVAVAWGYVADVEAGDAILDRVAAMLYRLGARR